MYKNVKDNLLTVSRPDKNLSIYVVSTTSKNEILAYYLTKYLVEVTSKFYIDTKTSVAKNNLVMLQHEADSLGRILSGSIASTARVYDNTFNLNSALQAQRAPAQEGQLRVGALGTAYGEVIKNLELAKITLQKETPLYQVIDQPHLPLEAEKPGKLMSLFIGGFIGGFLALIFFLCKKILSSYW
jgi:capsule polysaccharide export protein KpsE/RkpR